MAKQKVMYMHTIDRKPAVWSDWDEQIVYADVAEFSRDRTRTLAILRPNLRAIRRDQQATIRNRRRWGFESNAGKYGYVRVVLP